MIRARKTPVRQVQQAVSKLRRVQAPMTGVILNFADVMRDSVYKYPSYYTITAMGMANTKATRRTMRMRDACGRAAGRR